MIRIAITAAAFDAVAATLPLGSVGFEREPAEGAMRLKGEDVSDTILWAGQDRGLLKARA